jgi:Tfp pilus assembly protein PilN
MIELNLLEKKEPIKLPVVLGIDLNELNLIMLVVAVVVWYVPQMVLESYIEGEIANIKTEVEGLEAKNEVLKNEITKNGQIKEMLKAYQNQVEKLKLRSSQVDEVLRLRTNPKKILEKIARSIPEDVWFNDLKINSNNEIQISGGAYNNRSLGEFITIVNDSPYFAGSLTPAKQENRQESLDGNLVSFDYFELRGKIKSYDMRVK